MADENIPEVRYTELKALICSKCESSLVWDDPGVWYCEKPECGYTEYNNITKCEGEGCDNLVLSDDLNFFEMEERYCQIPHPEAGTCLGFAYSEQDQFLAEQYELEEHMKSCTSETCDCRNV